MPRNVTVFFLYFTTFAVMNAASFDIHRSTRSVGGRYGAMEMQEGPTTATIARTSPMLRLSKNWGTTPQQNTRLREVLTFSISLFRGAGQVVFQNSPISGLCIVAALFIQSKWIASVGMLGLASSTLAAIILDLGGDVEAADGHMNSKITNGLFGFNGLLCGLAMASFHGEPWDAAIILPCVFVASMSSILVEAFSKALPKDIPSLTLPFNLATSAYLLCAKGATNGLAPTCFQASSNVAASTAATSAVGSSTMAALLGEGILRGFGQVFLADGLWSSGLILLAMVIGHIPTTYCNGESSRTKGLIPKAAVASVCGSFLGALIAVSPSLMGFSASVASTGLWSYNALLGAAALSGGLVDGSNTMSMLCALCCAVVGGSMTTALAPLAGMPFLTFPFCIATMPFLFAAREIRD